MGRQIELEMSGADTELDRTVLDAIKDPLTHMVRNSADHGIEAPEERRAKGKPEIGKIKLNAFHEGGHVIISIEDDGAGINTEKVLQKAVKNGLISQSEAANLSHNEILSLAFKPGLSTAEEISSVSGRGVGMDVVKTAIERIGGTVDITSMENQGTSVRIKIPLTLAIISALVVESGGESFAIPQLGVVELVRLAAEDRDKIERIHDKEVFRLRDRLLPMMQLSKILELEDSPEDDQRDINIVVVQVGDKQFGLTVSEVFDTEEIVVKPVGRLLKDISIYQGTTILGDGRVIMILDVAGIAMQFGGLSTSSSDSNTKTENEGGAAIVTLLYPQIET
jgi:two-component system chemotaxis sensor kinase CheA